jgi:hypothetical protein
MSMQAAYNLFRSFHRRGPRKGEVIELQPDKVVAIVVGDLERIIYRVKGDTTSHIHTFPRTNRPVLCVSSDGLQAYILAGEYRFTDRGFVP